MLINVPSVTENGIKNKKELDEKCEFVAMDGEGKAKERVGYIFKENLTGIHFKLSVVKGWGDWSGGVDDQYDFPYTAEQIKNNVVEKKKREVVTEETYYE